VVHFLESGNLPSKTVLMGNATLCYILTFLGRLSVSLVAVVPTLP
jgi:hypothetical protein